MKMVTKNEKENSKLNGGVCPQLHYFTILLEVKSGMSVNRFLTEFNSTQDGNCMSLTRAGSLQSVCSN